MGSIILYSFQEVTAFYINCVNMSLRIANRANINTMQQRGKLGARMDTKTTKGKGVDKKLSTITNVPGKAVATVKPRQVRVAARRLIKAVEPVQPSQDEVESMDLEAINLDNLTFKEELEQRYLRIQKPLPVGVTDIDKDDIENPQLCSEYATDMYTYLRSIESKYCVGDDYLTSCPATGKMRTVLLDWLVDVQQQFKLLQETLYLTVSIIDRFMSVDGKGIQRNMLQLVGVSAMFLASKMEEIYAPELADFVYITDNAYSAEQVRCMERRIVKTLNYSFGEPLSINFLRRFSKAGDVDVSQHAMAKYVLEAMLLDYSLVRLPASERAALSLYLSLHLLNRDGDEFVWSKSLEHYSSYSSEFLQEKVSLVKESLKKVHLGKYTAVRQKYSSKMMHKIALHTDIKL